MSASVRLRAAAAGSAFALVVLVGSADYTVEQGDTLAEIAAANGTSVAALVVANNIADPDVIFPGQLLVIPGVVTGPATRYHQVAGGDTLAEIAALYDTTVEALMGANGLTNPDLIFVGTSLTIDGAPFVAAPVQSAAAHVVASGETLSGIAGTYGVTASELANLNGLDDPNLIVVGQTLNVPATGWTCPVAGATYFNDWGFPRSGGRFHAGNDLFAPRGTPVLAPVAGTVSQIIGQLGGTQFRLQGDDGNVYVGTHLDGFGFGGYVAAGTVIGYVGDSGNAQGSNPHLHFEIIAGGTEVNPYPTLQQYGC